MGDVEFGCKLGDAELKWTCELGVVESGCRLGDAGLERTYELGDADWGCKFGDAEWACCRASGRAGEEPLSDSGRLFMIVDRGLSDFVGAFLADVVSDLVGRRAWRGENWKDGRAA